MKIEQLPHFAVPVGEEDILNWIRDMERMYGDECSPDTDDVATASGDTKVERDWPHHYTVWRSTQTYEVTP